MLPSFAITFLSLIGQSFRLDPHLRKKRAVIARKYARGAILDVGCGPAEIVHYLHSGQCTRYVGIDANSDMIERLRRRYRSLSFFLVDVDNDDLPPIVSKSKFDTILLIAVVEHLRSPERILRKASALLKNDGRLIITTATPFGELIHNIFAVIGLTSKEAVKEHRRAARSSYSYQDLFDLSMLSGFEVEVHRRFELGLNQLAVLRKRKC
jgi:2-polyprenyl-3-methyl-5-hydroxy-6-metoxy-1,4-benzoquinol methylase